jgi:hypothetical protein
VEVDAGVALAARGTVVGGGDRAAGDNSPASTAAPDAVNGAVGWVNSVATSMWIAAGGPAAAGVAAIRPTVATASAAANDRRIRMYMGTLLG